MPTSSLQAVVRAARPPFLLLTPACVLLGVATALSSGAEIATTRLILALIGAICAHISVNTFNEYFDDKSGLDATTHKTPFSGGSGALLEAPHAAFWVLGTAIVTLAITMLVGAYFLVTIGAAIVPLGLVGVAIIVTYTQWINKSPWLCLIAPGLGFGSLMVVGTHFVLTAQVTSLPLIASLVPFFLVNNLLLLNQYPDIRADQSVGRNHFPIAYGVNTSNGVFGLFTLAATLTIIVAVVISWFPLLSLLALLPLIGSWAAFLAARQHSQNIDKLLPAMSLNVAATLLTPTVLALTLIFSGLI